MEKNVGGVMKAVAKKKAVRIPKAAGGYGRAISSSGDAQMAAATAAAVSLVAAATSLAERLCVLAWFVLLCVFDCVVHVCFMFL